MWIRTIPHFWTESMEANVCIFFLLCFLWAQHVAFGDHLIQLIIGFCRFYSDFSLTYVGAGMIVSHLVNLSLILGALLSHGLMWPLINRHEGDWFSESLQESDMKSLFSYKVSLSLSLSSYVTSSAINGFAILRYNFLAGFSIHCFNPRWWALQFHENIGMHNHQYS